jgi:phage FluMu protein Com
MPRISTQNPIKPCLKTVLPIYNASRDVTVFCPRCKTLETLSLDGEVIAPNRRFTQKASEVYHTCGSDLPCHHFF